MNTNPKTHARSVARLGAVQALYQQQMEKTATARLLVIYGVLTAAESVTPSLEGWMVLLTLVGYVAVYAVVFTAGIHYLRKVIAHGITELPPEGADTGRPKRPLSAVELEAESARSGTGNAPQMAPSFFKA